MALHWTVQDRPLWECGPPGALLHDEVWRGSDTMER